MKLSELLKNKLFDKGYKHEVEIAEESYRHKAADRIEMLYGRKPIPDENCNAVHEVKKKIVVVDEMTDEGL